MAVESGRFTQVLLYLNVDKQRHGHENVGHVKLLLYLIKTTSVYMYLGE